MKILFITDYLPSPKSNGAEIVTANFIDSLQKLDHQVTVIGHKRSGAYYQNHAQWENPIGTMTIETVLAKKTEKIKWIIRAFLYNLPITSAKYINAALIKFVKKPQHYDVVIINHTQLFCLYRYFVNIPIISIIHNHESNIYLDIAKQSSSIIKKIFYYREGTLVKKIENNIKRVASDIWALTDNDLKPFNGKGIVFKPYSFQDITINNDKKFLYDVGILGMWTWKPNFEAIGWFLKEVVPQLNSSLKIAIGGKGLPKFDTIPDNISLLGFVPDTNVFFSKCRMIAIPSLYDIGIQIKSIDALALGIPVVGTEIAFRNLDPLPDYAYAAKTATDFADHLMKMSSNELQSTIKTWNIERKECFTTLLDNRIRCVVK